MNFFEPTVNIQTLGRFCLSLSGKAVATEWPNEKLKELFCSILSPLDLYITWDRICRSIWEMQATEKRRERLEKLFIRPLNRFLTDEVGFTPLILEDAGIRIDHKRIQLDAFDFNSAVLEGLKLLSLNNQAAASAKFYQAKALYSGSYLPDMPGKIIANTRKELASIYRIANKGVIDEATSMRNTVVLSITFTNQLQ
jgi:hypothetical protein